MRIYLTLPVPGATKYPEHKSYQNKGLVIVVILYKSYNINNINNNNNQRFCDPNDQQPMHDTSCTKWQSTGATGTVCRS